MLAYTYTTTAAGRASRVASVKESDGNAQGGELTFEYGQNQTKMTDYKGNVQLLQFNNWGNTVSIQDGLGRAQYAGYAANNMGDSGKGNQLQLASKLQNTVANLISDHSFEGGTDWSINSNSATCAVVNNTSFLGKKSLEITPITGKTVGGVNRSFTAEPGKTYTFSAYVKTGSGRAYLAIYNRSSTVASETLAAGQDWTRLEVSYTNTTTAAQTVYAQVFFMDSKPIYVDCAQVEVAPTASRYNLIENGDFSFRTGWNKVSDLSITNTAAPQLDGWVLRLYGNPMTQNRVMQTIQVSGNQGDTYILGGWAWADSVPLTAYDTRDREFGLVAVFNYANGHSDEIPIHFNPYIDAWQYMAQAIVAPADYTSITVYIAYDYNANSVWFDGIQLFKEEFGSSYTYDDDGNVISVTDLQKKTTTYEYDTSGNLTAILQDNQAQMSYTYDAYHNVLSATSQEGLSYAFTYDDWGNNLSVSITTNGITMTTSAAYTQYGNQLDYTVDASGNKTDYYYNIHTNVLEWVQYPEDNTDPAVDDETWTEYGYDAMFRMVRSKVFADTGNLEATYTYTDDLLTKLVTGTTTYNFKYGNFALRSEILVGETSLATYAYESRTNLLKTLAYGNGDSVEYTYDDLGRIKVQTYEDGSTVTYAYDNDGALATVTDSASGRKITYYYDFTGRLMKYKETGNNYKHIVTYSYDLKNNLSAVEEVIDGASRTTTYTYDQDNRVIQTTEGPTGSTSITTRTYTYDGFGRMVQRTTTHSQGATQTETFSYVTSSGKTSNQVGTLTNNAGTFNYTYDGNGNILSVTHGGKTTSYTYDTVNQLLREDNEKAGKTWVYTYDKAGNILSKKEYAYTTGTVSSATASHTYTYGNTNWGDLLMAHGGTNISYDQIGNPLNDGTRQYTWEHGRQLATLTTGGKTWSYTYDANGMRTKRTNGTTTYNYIYNGSQLTKMTVDGYTLNFAYDVDGKPAYVVYDSTKYFYMTNLQGDVVAIADKNGNVLVEYTYDAWGNILTTTGSMATTLGKYNPLRYRGYVYDTESALYYLQSRYYDPALGRFINADAFTSTGQGILGNNMFAYCGNNPISRSDSGGNLWEALTIGFVAGLLGQYASDVLANFQNGLTGLEALTPTSSISDYFASGVGGAIAATPGLNFAGTVAVGAIASVTTEAMKGRIDSWQDVVVSAIKGGVANGIGYGISKGIAAMGVDQIGNMPRAARKVFLRDEFYCNSQSNVNVNLQTFASASLAENIAILESRYTVFKSGFYSTITSTAVPLLYGE